MTIEIERFAEYIKAAMDATRMFPPVSIQILPALPVYHPTRAIVARAGDGATQFLINPEWPDTEIAQRIAVHIEIICRKTITERIATVRLRLPKDAP